MIIEETLILHNKKFKHSYSSSNKYIKQIETGALYSHAYDRLKRSFTYVETDQEITEPDVPQDENI